MRVRKVIASALVAVVYVVSVRDAHAFCRTMTCPLPPSWSPANGCYPPDFSSLCAPNKLMPIWWRNACVSYDLQKNVSKWISYDTAVQVLDGAFAKWTGVMCPADAAGATRVSISATNLGPVECDQVGYKKNGPPNQNVIIFRDDTWPHANDANNTLGLTTVSFDPDTGEMYDADTEINGTLPLSVGDPVAPGAYDIESIITHEMGHFLGLAHSSDSSATMYARYTPASIGMRTLASDDMAGLCSIYPPNGTRNVDPSVGSGGSIVEAKCDPTPRHGFSSTCDPPPSSGCSIARGERSHGAAGIAMAIVFCLLGFSRVRSVVRAPPARCVRSSARGLSRAATAPRQRILHTQESTSERTLRPSPLHSPESTSRAPRDCRWEAFWRLR
jgi:hypothetical protein